MMIPQTSRPKMLSPAMNLLGSLLCKVQLFMLNLTIKAILRTRWCLKEQRLRLLELPMALLWPLRLAQLLRLSNLQVW